MASSTYTIELRTDGRHVVTISDNDPVRIQEQLAHAKGIFLKLQDLARQQPAGVTSSGEGNDPPICAIHQVPMAYMQGRKGPFWSCHAKDDDGNWCSLTREASQ
jgi:hypothetical protein